MKRSHLIYLTCMASVAIGAGAIWQSGSSISAKDAKQASDMREDAPLPEEGCAHKVKIAEVAGEQIANTPAGARADPLAPLNWSTDVGASMERARVRGRLVLLYVAQSGKT